MESLLDILRTWNKSTSERVKLQHAYMFIIVVVTVVAGLFALINVELGHKLIIVAGIGLVALIANALVWALTRVYFIDRLERKRTNKK